jgi:subtilisin family serine protease
MRIRAVVLLATTLFIAAGAVAPPAIAAPNPTPPRNTTGEPIPDQYLVTMNTGYDPHEIVNRLGITPLFVYSTAIVGFAAKLTPLQLTLLRKAPGVASIEPDVTIHQQYTPQAPSRAVSSWGLDRINQRALPLDGTYTPAHDGANVTVYIIDSGIDYTHSEFGGRATFGYDAIGDGKQGADCEGHGTHVAGTVGGATYGVARKVKLVSVRVLDCTGEGTGSGILAGFDWVTGHAVKPAVANASLGTTPGFNAVDSAANGMANNGVFTVVAAGNDTADACGYSPARAAEPLTVGATDITDDYAYYSNSGGCVQLYAPGTDIVSAKLGGGSATESGTSMASPHVAGIAALYKQANGDKTQSEISSWLINQSTPDKITLLPADSYNNLLYSGGL